MARLYSFRGFSFLLFYFLRCLVGFEQRQELLSPFASNENAIELSSRLACDPPVAYAARSRSSLGNTAHDNHAVFGVVALSRLVVSRVRLPLHAANWDDP